MRVSLKPNVGGHHYPGCANPFGDNFFTSNCSYGCGCWMGSSRSGGPDGVDPFGACPVQTQKIAVQLNNEPSGGSFSSGPSGDSEFEAALDKWRAECNERILKAIPRGYRLAGSDIKTETVTKTTAEITITRD